MGKILVYSVYFHIIYLIPKKRLFIASWIESSLKSESLGFLDRINFSNKIMTDRVWEKGEQHRRYKIVK